MGRIARHAGEGAEGVGERVMMMLVQDFPFSVNPTRASTGNRKRGNDMMRQEPIQSFERKISFLSLVRYLKKTGRGDFGFHSSSKTILAVPRKG